MIRKNKDWYISLYIKFISKENTVNKYSSLLYVRLAEILSEIHTCGLQNTPRNKMDCWVYRWMEKWIDT